MISTDQIKELRAKTGISIAQCKQALTETAGDIDKALAALKKQGAAIAEKKADRRLGATIVRAYIHATDNLGSLVEIQTETDFVAKNEALKDFAAEMAMHIAAADPSDIDELLDQDFIKDPSKKISDLLKENIQKFGERIEIKRFVRFDGSA
ncbi:MAG: translation elongation factor Ts [Candidatus Paceibacterota bacterium]